MYFVFKRRKNSSAPRRNCITPAAAGSRFYAFTHEIFSPWSRYFAIFPRNLGNFGSFRVEEGAFDWQWRKREGKRQEPLTVRTPKKFCKNRRVEVRGGGERKGHHLKANTPKLSSRRIRARPRHRIHKARRISLALRCGDDGGGGSCPALRTVPLHFPPPRICSLSALRPTYLPSGVVHLSQRILLNKYLSLLRCRHARVRGGFSLIEKRLFYSAPSQRENMMSCCALWNFFILARGEQGDWNAVG